MTIGADPELFLSSRKNHTLVSAFGRVGGTKGNPVPLEELPEVQVQEDNVMLEYNVSPAETAAEFVAVMQEALDGVRNFARVKLKADLLIAPVTEWSGTQLTGDLQEFGCVPDFDAYEQGMEHEAMCHADTRCTPNGRKYFRFAGGHVHIGYDKPDNPAVPEFVVAQLCDVLISCPLIDYGYDTQGQRRKFYGQAGRFRPTSYGIEYRSPGNTWTSTPDAVETVGRGAETVINLLRQAEESPEFRAGLNRVYTEIPWGMVKKAVEGEDHAQCNRLYHAASDLLTKNKLY